MTARTFLYSAAALFCLGQPVSAMSDAEIREMSAFLINTNGYLCARVLSIAPLGGDDDYLVRCIEKRDGSGRVSYLMNARTGVVLPN